MLVFFLDDFKEKGYDLEKELVYTGHVEYEERMKEFDVHLTNKYVPYIAVKLKIRKNYQELWKKKGKRMKKVIIGSMKMKKKLKLICNFWAFFLKKKIFNK